MSRIIKDILKALAKRDQLPPQFFKVKSGKLDQTELRFKLKELDIFLSDYGDEYEKFCSSVAYPSDLNQIDSDKLLSVLEFYGKKLKVE